MNAATSRFSIGIGALLVLAIVVSGCGTPVPSEATTAVTIDASDEALRQAYLTWVNMVGLNQSDLAIWRRRLSEACTLGVWDKTVAVDLATRYIAEDASVSLRTPELGPAPAEDAADTLWIMAVGVCRDKFPPGTIAKGPPFYPDMAFGEPSAGTTYPAWGPPDVLDWPGGLTIRSIPPGFSYKSTSGTADERRSSLFHTFASPNAEFSVGRKRFDTAVRLPGRVVTVAGREFIVAEGPTGVGVQTDAGGGVLIEVVSRQLGSEPLLRIAEGVTYDPARDP